MNLDNWAIYLFIIEIVCIWYMRKYRPFSPKTRHAVGVCLLAYTFFTPFMIRGVAIGHQKYVFWFLALMTVWLFISIATGGLERDENGNILKVKPWEKK